MASATGASAARDCLAGGGKMGALMRAFDWSTTSLGPVAQWPQSLQTTVSTMLASGFPMLLLWGRDYVQLYNDPYRPVLGATKHPAALGQQACDCWPEIWESTLAAMLGQVMAGGDPIWSEDLLFYLDRNGYLEETFFTFSYSAIRDESGLPGGVLATCVETTERVVGERRLETLRALAASASGPGSVDGACARAVTALARNPHDVPFALIYLLDGERARLAGCAGLELPHPAAPSVVELGTTAAGGVWPLADAVAGGAAVLVTELTRRVGACPGGPWPEPAEAAAVIPIAHAGGPALGVLVAGISPRGAYGTRYGTFVDLVAAQIATGVSNARAYEAERERAEALAQIDRAKTSFFSNVSHEFRTPLTLMLGPTEAALASPDKALRGRELEMVHRNQQRLLKLVNALLDFSRIEAGRTQATYRLTDLSALTRELAGAFRSAVESAGLLFEVDCQRIAAPVYVDRDMWEKVVMNLLSNAFKFTFEGSIRITMAERQDRVALTIQDTGSGIPDDQVSRVFERFHRVEGTRSRTHEGSGIGLALTNELVRLHGGEIAVTSRLGEGSIFTVLIPTGTAHLPQEHVDSESAASPPGRGTTPFVDEANRWLPHERAAAHAAADDAPAAARERILVVDDNADMRDYLTQLLRDWEVETVGNGAAALERARRAPPHLIVTDVMMPGLDGFGLLAALRADPRTGTIPVLMLSARSGEEARVSGLTAGADDYVTKPFSARELTARVRSVLALAEARRRSELANRAKDEFLAMLGHELRNPLAPILTALQLMTLRGYSGAERERSVIDRQVRHLARLVDDLMDVSRFARGRIDLHCRPIELGEVVASAIEEASPLLEERRHYLELQVSAAGLLVNADPTRLTQVITNLLTNAAKYTEPGGRIEILAGPAGNDIELRVRDSGIGIAPELLPQVFDMFTQDRQELARSQGGLGLGLTIARSLITLHGGSIEARSDGRGKGSEFVVRLPALVPAPSGVAGAATLDRRASAIPQLLRRVLVVDDNADAALLTAAAFEAVGWETRAAFDGPHAVAMATAFHPDAVLLDLGLPVMDGFEVARDIRAASAAGGEPRLVAVTGYGQPADRERTTAAGFHAHVVKPVDVHELVTLLDRLVIERAP